MPEKDPSIFAWMTLVSWICFLKYLRVFKTLRVFIRIMEDCVKNAAAFAMVLSIMFVSFACAQYAAVRFKTNASLVDEFGPVFVPILKSQYLAMFGSFD